MNRKVLIINGHPDSNSFSTALAEAYGQGVQEAGAELRLLNLHELDFDPILRYGYKKRTELEPDLLRAWQWMQEADHTVWVYPTWWGGLPALLKGFIDRLFLPGFTFKYREDSRFWDRLMKGKTARVITTMDAPVWFYRLQYGSPAHKAMKRMVLQFCGFSTKMTTFGNLKHSSTKQRKKWLQKVERLGWAEGRPTRR